MKNMFLFLLTLVAAVALRAQPAHTPPRDTIVGREVTYYYQEGWGTFCSVYFNAEMYDRSSYLTGYGFTTDSTLRNCGLAMCVGRAENPYLGGTTGSEWLVQIAEAGSGGHFIPLASQLLNSDSISRWMKVHGHATLDNLHMWQPDPEESDTIIPVTEVYFDSTVTVDDSFYVCYRPLWGDQTNDLLPSRWWVWKHVWGWCHQTHMWAFFHFNTEQYQFGRVFGEGTEHMHFIFPIIDSTGWYLKCDTFVCDMVKGIELSVNREYGMVACSWLDDTLLHSEWELSYGPAGTPPGGGRVVHASEPHWVVTGLEDTVDYVFYVRGLCEECNVWCDWSEGMVAYAEQRGTEGIMRPEQLDAMTYVVPNPARDKARVGSEYGVLRVALYDVRGRAALVWHSPQGDRRPVRGVELDLGGLAAGVYVADVATPYGTVKKKLIVQR